jgi:hypothetical protein
MQTIASPVPLPVASCEAWALAPDVLLVPAPEGGARIIDMNGSFHALSTVAADMLRVTLADGAEAAVCQVARNYGADVRQVKCDLDVFLGQLQALGLLCRGPARRRRPGRTAAAYLLVLPALWLVGRCLPLGRLRVSALLTLAWLSFRCFGWGPSVAVWRRCPRHDPPGLSPEQGRQVALGVDEQVRRAAAGHLLAVACKERALCCWALARSAGLPAALVIGIQFCPLAGHCWCEAGPWTLSDDRDRCDCYQPIFRYT